MNNRMVIISLLGLVGASHVIFFGWKSATLFFAVGIVIGIIRLILSNKGE